MKRNFNFQLVSLSGVPLSQNEPSATGEFATDKDGVQIPDGKGSFLIKQVNVPLFAASMVSSALLYVFPDETNVSADEKTLRYKLAKRVQEAYTAELDVELTMEEMVSIKLAVGKLWAPLVVGQIVAALES